MKRFWLSGVFVLAIFVGCTSVNQSVIQPSETPSFDMPEYYTSHPALIYLGLDYSPNEQNHVVVSTVIPTPTPDLTQYSEFGSNIFRQDYAPDGNTILVTSFVTEPSAPMTLGKTREQSLEEGFPAPPERDFYKQAWLVNLDTGKVKSLFAAYELFVFQWIDSRYGLIHSICYGDPSIEGLHIIDTKLIALSTIDTSYSGNCEGGVSYSIAPDAKHLIIGKKVITITDNEQTAVCVGDKFARSYAWSPDGRYVYIACANEYDQLHRYDTQTHEEVNLTQNTGIAFKAIKMSLSSDGELLLFEWGTSDFFNQEEYGTWAFALAQLAELSELSE